MAEREQELDYMVRRRSEGATQAEIASEIGKSRSYVQKRLATGRSAPARTPTSPAVRVVGSTRRQASRVAASSWGKAEGALMDSNMSVSLPPPTYLGEWQSIGLDGDAWRSLGRKMTLPALADTSPAISRAIWDYLRMLDPGHEVLVYHPGTEEVHEEGTALLEAFIETRLNPRYNSLKGMFQQMFMGALFRGAYCMQVVTDEDVREAVGILIPDPIVIRFRPMDDADEGLVWEPGIVIKGEWQSVESELFRYVPVDPLPGQPYGRSMIAPATFPAIFSIGLMYDLRRVVAQQGYPRIDIEVDDEMIRNNYPDMQDRNEFEEMLQGIIDDIGADVQRLEPDDFYIHTKAVKVNNSKGAVDSGVVSGASGLIEVLERMEVRALKTMPLLMGITDGVSEANANRQYEIFAQGVKTMQQHAENVTQTAFENVLRIAGIAAEVQVRFAEIRSAEMLRDATTMQKKVEVARQAEEYGYMTGDEASIYAVGHPKPEPEEGDEPSGDAPSGIAGDDDSDNPADDSDPGLAESDDNDRWRRGVRAITEMEYAYADAYWSSVFNEEKYRDVLTATSVERDDVVVDGWRWVRSERVYRHDDGEELTEEACIEIANRLAEETEARVREEIDGLAGESSRRRSSYRLRTGEVDETLDAIWSDVQASMVASFIFGRGGYAEMSPADHAELDALVAEQENYWIGFEGDVYDHEDMDGTIGEMERRAPLYVTAGLGALYLGRGRAWGIDPPEVPPLHPGCRCQGRFGEDDDGVYFRWVPSANPCDLCVERQAEYDGWRA